MKTTIIIIKYNYPEIEEKCIDSILQNTKAPYHLLAYENHPENQNIGKLWNKLIRNCDSEYICLLNTDTIVTPNWLTYLTEVFDKQRRVGAVGPSTNHSKNHQSSIKDIPKQYTTVNFSAEYEGECLSGFCLVFPKNIHNLVGGFPEDFGFYGQEVTFLDRVSMSDYDQVWRKDAFVWHEGSATVKREENAGRFNEKKERETAREKFFKLRERFGL